MFATSSWLPSILALAVAVGGVKAQGDLSDTNNITSLEGTWSSNVHVQTGGVSHDSRGLNDSDGRKGKARRKHETTSDGERMISR